MQFRSDELILEGHLALPERIPSAGAPGFVICHGFPTAAIGAARSGQSYHSLADRIAEAKGAAVLAMHYRGCGGSEGDFSLAGWLRDIEAAIDTMAALSICAAASRPQVRAVAAVAPPADFSDWSNDPEQLMAHAKSVGAITSPDFPKDFDAWAAELSGVQAVVGAGELSPRPLLILHGADDELVPLFDSRIVADAHGSAELRVIQGAGHLLRYDPRAIAVLLGWVDRLRYNTSMI